ALLTLRRDLRQGERLRLQVRRARAADALTRRQARRHADAPWQAWFDGSATPNPGRCTIGAVLAGPLGERIEIAAAVGHGNSSEAEYHALLAVLRAALRRGAAPIAIHGDSRVVIDDLNGPEHRAAPSLAPLRAEALALLAQCGDATLRWIPRHRNT